MATIRRTLLILVFNAACAGGGTIKYFLERGDLTSLQNYIEKNISKIMVDASVGEGDSLEPLFKLYACTDGYPIDQFKEMLKDEFAFIFEDKTVYGVAARLDYKIKSHHSLRSCRLKRENSENNL